MRILRTACCTLAVLAVLAPAATAQTAVAEDLYVPVADGTELRVQIERPAGDGPFPTLFAYTGYSHRVDGPLSDWALANGYAIMGATPRGASCSAGDFDFLSPQEARDGAFLVEWVAEQNWSNGRVALFGDSYTGFMQLPVASLKPKGLVAIAPGQPIADLYRDVGYPGGIPNRLIPTAFQAVLVQGWLTEASSLSDQKCTANQSGLATDAAGGPAALVSGHPFDDATMRERAPGAAIGEIDVPMFTVVAWQDDTLGSRALEDLVATGGKFHAILSNGGHGWPSGVWYSRRAQSRLKEFLDYYVKGVDNGFDKAGPIEVWWESERVGSMDIQPRWVSDFPGYPAPESEVTDLYLTKGGGLADEPGANGRRAYAYAPTTGQGQPSPLLGGAWKQPAPPDMNLTYTSEPFSRDLAVLGAASLDLWLSSTAADTDLHAIVTEVRPDGNEVYVQEGLLRASQRALNAARSTATRPVHPHGATDLRPLVPTVAELARMEIRPFGHVFRKGARLRVWVEAPPETSWLWSFESLPTPARNEIRHGQSTPSVLRLRTLPGHSAEAPQPACGSVLSQACRPDPRAPAA